MTTKNDVDPNDPGPVAPRGTDAPPESFNHDLHDPAAIAKAKLDAEAKAKPKSKDEVKK